MGVLWLHAGHLLHAAGVCVSHSLGAIGIGTAEALVAANDGVAKVCSFEAGEGVRGGGLGDVDAVEAARGVGG
jgi:hypothetical protein